MSPPKKSSPPEIVARQLEDFDAARQLHRFYQDAEKRLERVLKASSSIWTRSTELKPEKIPQFTPMENRPNAPGGGKTRIVSFINLKGGVGQTTSTANLVAAFASDFVFMPTATRCRALPNLIFNVSRPKFTGESVNER